MILKAALFDLDGLLIDSEPLHMKAWQKAAENEGVVLTSEDFKRFVGTNNRAVAEYVASKSSRSAIISEILADKTERYLELLRTITPMAGVKELLARLKRNHLRLAVVSSSPRVEAVQALQYAGIYGSFDCVVTGSDVNNLKPAPDSYRLAMRKLNVSHSECVAFEDSASGVAAVKNAGVFCIAIPHKLSSGQDLSRADLLLDSLALLTDEKSHLLATKNPVIGKLVG